MENMAKEYLSSPEGQKMVLNFISSPEGINIIKKIIDTPEGKQAFGSLVKNILPALGVNDEELKKISGIMDKLV